MTTIGYDECLVCGEECDEVACEFCEEVSCCGDDCEEEDFMLHRVSCNYKGRNLAMQKYCAVCNNPLGKSGVPPVVCKQCRGIKYCSDQCKLGNEAEHKLFCKAYANLPLRPTTDHRLHIFFPANETHPRFLWLEPEKPSRQKAIDPEGTALKIESSYRSTHTDGNHESYKIVLYHRAAFLNSKGLPPNQSLGTATGNPPSRSMKGNALLCIDRTSSAVEDVFPSNLPELLAFCQKEEIRHERTHDPKSGFPQSATPY